MSPKMSDFTPQMPHGELKEVFPGIHFVTGTTRPFFEGKHWQFSRNMTVVREGDALTLINTVRLDEAGLAALERLGEVKSVVKLGSFHGIDDAFYVDRYGAKLWALAGMVHESGLPTDVELGSDSMPFVGAKIFVFETSKMPEGLLLIEREGGIVVSCDSLQNWAEADRFFDDETAKAMTEVGFIKPANVGPSWARFAEPKASDFERVLALPFKHLLSAHGSPILDDAKERFAATFRELYGVNS